MLNFRIAGISALIGFLAGAFGALVGVGGGAVVVPLLTGWLGFAQHVAHGTSLISVGFTGLVGAFTYFRGGALDLESALTLGIPAGICAALGARATRGLEVGQLKGIFGILLLLVAASLLVEQFIMPDLSWLGAARWPLLVAGGAFAGYASGLLGIGGGTVLVPLLVFVAGLDQHLAQGTSLLAMVFPSVVGGVVHNRMGQVNWQVLPYLLIGSFLGAYLGGFLALIAPADLLRWIFALVMGWTGVGYLRRR